MVIDMNTELLSRRTLWSMAFAWQSISHAKAGFEGLQNAPIASDSALYSTVLCGAVVSYGRPFKQQYKWARIPERVVPREHLDTHAVLITTRDKLFAHTDAKGIIWHGYNMNEVLYRISGQGSEMLLPHHTINAGQIPRIVELLDILIKKFTYHVDKQHAKLFRHAIYDSGLYSLSVDDDENILLARREDDERPGTSLTL